MFEDPIYTDCLIHISDAIGVLDHGGGGAMFYKHFPFLVDYIAKNDIFRPKISKIMQYIEVILSETNDD